MDLSLPRPPREAPREGAGDKRRACPAADRPAGRASPSPPPVCRSRFRSPPADSLDEEGHPMELEPHAGRAAETPATANPYAIVALVEGAHSDWCACAPLLPPFWLA